MHLLAILLQLAGNFSAIAKMGAGLGAGIAVIGAGDRPTAVGHQVLRNILEGGFTGRVYAVNPRHETHPVAVHQEGALATHGLDISPSFFPMLGIEPALGRT